MSRTVRILLLFGVLVFGLALAMLGLDERTAGPDQSTVSRGEPRIGRSTLSHGGSGTGRPAAVPERSDTSLRPPFSTESPEAIKR